ncbi:hypothetical protein D3C85_1366200 [compost metagenome]
MYVVTDFDTSDSCGDHTKIIDSYIIPNDDILTVVIRGLIGKTWIFSDVGKPQFVDLLTIQKSHFNVPLLR